MPAEPAQPAESAAPIGSAVRALFDHTPVLPVLTLEHAASAGDLACALAEGGITVFEVLLRTPAALDAITAMARAVPQARVGAGTLLRPQDLLRARDAGACFGVSPALSDTLVAAARAAQLPWLPGVSTPGEVLHALESGFDTLKLFPAQGTQGLAWLQAIAPVFPQVRFCPTGGIRPPDIPAYLAAPNCIAVGGSWVAPPELLARRDWAGITALARQASAFGRA